MTGDDHQATGGPARDDLIAFRALIVKMARPPLRISQNAIARSMGITSGYLSQVLNPSGSDAVRSDVVGRAVERARTELENCAGRPDVPTELVQELRVELQRLSLTFPYHSPKRAATALPTIGMVIAGGTISLAYDLQGRRSYQPTTREMEAYFERETRGVAHLKFLHPPWRFLPDNSVNLTPTHWSSLARTIHDALQDPDIDGVVVAHGLDAITFTATAVSFALGDVYSLRPHPTNTAMLPKPVVFTGSLYPWSVPNNDAESNLKTACVVASSCNTTRSPPSGQLCTVLLCMQNTVLSPAHTLASVRQGMTEFVPLGYPIAQINGDQIMYTLQSGRQPNTVVPRWQEPDFRAPIRVLQPLPGDELWSDSAVHRGSFSDWLDPAEGEKLAAVAIIAQGSGAIPLSDEHSTRRLLIEAKERDIPVFIGSETPNFSSPPDLEATSVVLADLGATPMLGRTKARLVVKLRWAASGRRSADGSWRNTVIDRMKFRHPAEIIEM
jgi:L-asparaginase/Glu-tRNA(Gln) amidotransferase subunit D